MGNVGFSRADSDDDNHTPISSPQGTRPVWTNEDGVMVQRSASDVSFGDRIKDFFAKCRPTGVGGDEEEEQIGTMLDGECYVVSCISVSKTLPSVTACLQTQRVFRSSSQLRVVFAITSVTHTEVFCEG